jgi:hypothetical protein
VIVRPTVAAGASTQRAEEVFHDFGDEVFASIGMRVIKTAGAGPAGECDH